MTEAPAGLVERRVNQQERRRLTLRTFIQGGFLPRRRGARRASDLDLAVDLHEPYLLLLSVAMLVLSVADAFLTVTLMADGAPQTDPLLAFVINEHPRLFTLVKIALSGIVVVVLVAVARAKLFKVVRVTAFLQALVVAYSALVACETWLAL